MKKELTNKKIIFLISIFLLIVTIISIIFYINLKKSSSITAEATVTYVGNNYIVVSDEEGEEYFIKTSREYNTGDKVLFTMKDIKKGSQPIEGTIERLDTISKSVDIPTTEEEQKEEIKKEQKPIEEASTNNNTQKPEPSNNNEVVETLPPINNQNNSNDNQVANETAVVSYLENLNYKLDSYSQDKSLGQSIKEGFVRVVDFLFYKGEISGYTFESLSATTKLKVLKLALSIDQKVEKYFPGYKEQISSTGSRVYTNVKTKIVESYLDITTKVCANNPDVCREAKIGFGEMKKSFSLTWDLIKDISGVGLSKLKAWYEIWRTT